MAYIYPAPGNSAAEATLTLYHTDNSDAASLSVAALQDITVNAANNVFTWTQLDSSAANQVATTANNSVTVNLVLDATTFFGTTGSGGTTATASGIMGLSIDKTPVYFSLYMGDNDSGSDTKTISGTGYITGLAPTVSADAPVWVSPVTITVSGEYTIT